MPRPLQQSDTIAFTIRSMTPIEEHHGLLRLLITSACLVIVIAGMHAAEAVLVPLLLAAFISLLSSPLLMWLRKKWLPAIPAITLVICLILGILAGLAVLLGSSLDDLYRNLPKYQDHAQEELTAITAWLNRYGFPASQEQILKYFDPGIIFSLVRSLLGGLGTAMTNGFLIFLAIIFMLGEASYFPDKLRGALGDRFNSEFVTVFTRTIQRYMSLKTLIGLVKGLLVGCWVAVIGVDYAMVWGFIAFLFNYIPNIGPIMAAIPAILLALIDAGPWTALYIGIGYLAINVIIGDLVEPRIMGKGMGLSTLVVFLSLVVWAWVLGPVGMFLSVPLTMIIKIALDTNEETRWVAILLGPEDQLPKQIEMPAADRE